MGIAEWGAVRCSRKVTPRGPRRNLEAALVTIDQRCSLCEHSLLDSSGVGGVGLVEESNRMFVQSFERGLEVIRSFNEECPRQSLSEVADERLQPRSCRRLLFTLETLGYVGVDGREFFLQPRILDIGYSFSRHCVSRHRRALRPGLE